MAGVRTVVDRRLFLGMAGVCLAAAHAAEPTPRTARIGFVGYGAPSATPSQVAAFRKGLRDLGWIEGQGLTIDYRWAEGHVDRLPTLVADLIGAKVDVMLVSGSVGIRAAQSVTSTVPVVFVVLVDPVDLGLVSSLARPGRNMTGVASQFELLITKQLQLLKETLPDLFHVALLNHKAATVPSVVRAAEAAARQLGLQPHKIDVADVDEFESAFKTARSEGARAIVVLPYTYFDSQHGRLIELAARYRLPAFYEFRNYVRDGGLMSYGPSIDQMYYRAASYVDRILKGADPGRLPIERPPKFELVINLKTAASLGLTFPQSLMLQVDEAIR